MFCGDCVKTCEDVAPNFGENIPGCFTMTRPRLTLPSSPSSFWRNKNGCHPPPTVLHWFGTLWLFPISQNEIEAERTPVWYHWGDPGRIAQSAWHCDRKGLPGSVPKMQETLGLVSTCGRELLRVWWRPMGLMLSFIIFTASVRNILDTLVYALEMIFYVCYPVFGLEIIITRQCDTTEIIVCTTRDPGTILILLSSSCFLSVSSGLCQYAPVVEGMQGFSDPSTALISTLILRSMQFSYQSDKRCVPCSSVTSQINERCSVWTHVSLSLYTWIFLYCFTVVTSLVLLFITLQRSVIYYEA
jgi:hypothetical protein